MTFDYVGDAAATPSMKTLRIEVAPYLPGIRIVGEVSLDSRFIGRKVACLMLHDLVDEILDKIYSPQPRQSAEESIIDEIRKLEGAQCK